MGFRSIAFLAKGLACSSLCRLSFGSEIYSRMILRRASCSGLHVKILCPNGGRRQHKGRLSSPKTRFVRIDGGLILLDVRDSADP